MADLIDREKLLKQIDFLEPVADEHRFTKQQLITAMNGMKQSVMTKIKVFPSADTERHAHWVKSEIPNEEYTCSNCGGACWYYECSGTVCKSKYCPSCGYKMDEVSE